jgi:hypothetical protein
MQRSPFSDVVSSHLPQRVAAEYLRCRCALLHVSPDAPLAALVEAADVAAPTLQRLAQVMRVTTARSLFPTSALAETELAAELPLPPHLRFHSVFACPVSRAHCAPASNPPMLLPCGHVISRESLARISHRGTFKCPTCPMVTSMPHAVALLLS